MPELFVPPESVLVADRSAERNVALSVGGAAHRWADWIEDVACWSDFWASEDSQSVGLYCSDSYHFSIQFFSLLSAGKTICLLANVQEGARRDIDEMVDCFVGDFDTKFTGKRCINNLLNRPSKPTDISSLGVIDCVRTSVLLFTSGSAGIPECIPKTFGQLSREVITLERQWGKKAAGSVSLSTVSHQHIYGLLFHILWPISAGRAFHREVCKYAKDIIINARPLDKLVLVSSPSHLMRLPPSLDWPTVQEKLQMVFSSTAPLTFEAAQLVRSRLGQLPYEVFGSSETGGVARRRQHKGNESWRAFDGIKVRAESNRMEIASPHMPDANWHPGSDYIELVAEGEFRLRGRVDTIVKVEGKRVSLTRIESLLSAHPMVEQARALLFRGRRDSIVAVVILNEAGRTQLCEGKRQVTLALGQYMQEFFEPVTLPKKFRFVTHLPTDKLGKTPVSLLQKLFAQGDTYRKLPDVQLFQKLDEENWSLGLHVPANLAFFDGHFPGQPILPGMALVFWADYYSKLLFPNAGLVQRLDKLKFQRVLTPYAEATLMLKEVVKMNLVEFKVLSDSGSHATGRLVYHSD